MRPSPPDHAMWRKASRTNASGANCVEVAGFEDNVAVRDSKDNATADFPRLTVRSREWIGMIESIKHGGFDC